jgi:hypothetical protein
MGHLDGPNSNTRKVKLQNMDMAAIPEADTPMQRSKRRADIADQSSLEHVERIKPACNIDTTPNKGNNTTSQNSFLQFSNEQVMENLNTIDISLGTCTYSISSSVSCVKRFRVT